MRTAEILQLIQQNKVRLIDCRFLDFPGTLQHCTYTASQLTEASFEEGFGFDGSSIRGWQAINESDMLIVPVPETAVLDPFYDEPTLSIICDIKDPVTKKTYSRDPRSIARKAEAYLVDSGIADTAYFGPELEFFVFDHVRFDQSINRAVYEVHSREGQWESGRDRPDNFGRQLGTQQGYFPCPPSDTLQGLRNEMVHAMTAMGLDVECHHHEVATGGQCEIDLRYQDLLTMADQTMRYKYVVKQCAARHGQTATFMPKPLHGDNGSGMHTHFSLWKDDHNLFAGKHYAGLSDIALHAIAGILHHAPALLAFTNPTTNSYKRLIPGFEAPVHPTYSSRNRSAAIRIPVYNPRPETKRLEFRCPDPSANPYLAFAAILMAALDGIQRKLDPGDPIDQDVSSLPQEQLDTIGTFPLGLHDALNRLEADHDFLLKGNVFTPDVVQGWIRYKRETEIRPLDERPHPYEFCMYFDA
ncbi:MAG: type I glutamate--ammonia ligase [Planctomycetota bacterium]